MWKMRELLLNSSSSEQLLRVRQPFTAHYRNEIPLHVHRFVQVVSSVYIVPSVRSFIRVNNRVCEGEKQTAPKFAVAYPNRSVQTTQKSLDVTSDQYLMSRTFRNERCDNEHFVKIFIDRSFSNLQIYSLETQTINNVDALRIILTRNLKLLTNSR